ncbi:MAG: bifunctional diaminohydroxyphosphoribosylaminopyrimidine deaminase/5-amino-6-(5-phosphoribosylamino)uracil reductase RibD [Bacteroidales bacterium]|nr:bifunctional diaminohydroxyphosphoribosylaminopyrimidine deaminase/5-amino-6-(5-phosphoribosylamino)uracil reductase RibD [Bacteroidales bacterium]MDD6731878.1 bifunctional diaminohydroxyphosphoribosylaminopyrimidine deaminase/5-amino-6-(5-phosphoribosylamino)uracil reductase RibD [Bacteroidales bacterium]MDY4557179.1 bifunctional diaminohydroxyphosphoribosylaminopyrimidine deaminase/5-amino-6-(5-phosphoribosylamino)uracil reductase RibD [Alloprevotella sp.]
MKSLHELYMHRCLELARCGRLHAAPNPMVGAVLVHDGRIIGEGYHIQCGQAHAEVNALRSVRPADRALLADSTLYVSLEPCAHYGRTPPCASLIIKSGIPRVVVGCIDSFSKVQGRGIAMLREAGVDVTVGVLEEECKALNRRFFTAQTLHRPYITLKWARSADGFIDRWRETDDEEPARLSTPCSLMRVHRLRAIHQAILVGHGTLLKDHPTLTVRHWTGKNPLRIVLGRVAEGEMPAGFQAYADIPTMLGELFRQGVQSLLVEGGQQTLQSFIDQGLWEEAYVELSATELGSGVPEPRMPIGILLQTEQAFGSTIFHYTNG